MISWNEIRKRAVSFSNEWEGETNESAEAKSFWDGFFHVFGISRRRVAAFERSVKKAGGEQGYVDLLWKGLLLVEHKSKGKNLEKAYTQARSYFPGLKEAELPRYIIISDFDNFVLYDLEENGERRFKLSQLPENIELFGFIAGYQQQEIKEQDPVNIYAAEQMGILHDKLKSVGYDGHDLEVFLVRLLFCLFADDTGIYEKDIFRDYIENKTKEDGSDLGIYLTGLFETLNTPAERRTKNIDVELNRFPYVNGALFENRLSIASFDSEMRELLLESCSLDWGKISPAVFGSLFQSAMDIEERRELGAHYTSEENIMKVIEPLFLDELWVEFDKLKNLKNNKIPRLDKFHEKLGNLNFLDPACGCGNFLIITYRELRLLELEVIRELTKGEPVLDLSLLVRVDVDQFYGIEIDEFASQIAQVALWLIDHQMNIKTSTEFGQYFIRLPLTKKPNIVYDNALTIDWNDVIPSQNLNYILGNPPFVGNSMLTAQQDSDLKGITSVLKKSGHLDFVAGWYLKAGEYIRFTPIKVGLVSTNSIVQGEQALNLWKYMIYSLDTDIFFAHQTFRWSNEAKGKAAVYCVIIGFSSQPQNIKNLYTYPDINGNPEIIKATNINQYLLDAPTIFIKSRSKPLSDVPPMIYGTKPTDGGFLLFKKEEMEEFIREEPLSEKYFRPWIGSQEMLKGFKRYCLYLANASPAELREMPLVRERVESVRKNRLNSKAPSTRKWADYPTLFKQDNATDSDVLIIPRVSSEKRNIVPIDYWQYPTICSDSAFQVIDADDYLFGMLNSSMHMAWMRTVCGRLKGDYRYSNTIVYNNFIFPHPTKTQKEKIEKNARKILEIRKKFINSTLADLYDPIVTPPELHRAHKELDQAVDKAYGKSFTTDESRVSYLFEKYQERILVKK